MGKFDDMATVQSYTKKPWFNPGKYSVEIKAIKYYQGRGDSFVIMETFILESDQNDAHLQPGCEVSQRIKITGPYAETGKANFKVILAQLWNWDIKDESLKWSKISDLTVQEKEPHLFAGTKFKLECYYRDKKNKPEEKFTVHDWTIAERKVNK